MMLCAQMGKDQDHAHGAKVATVSSKRTMIAIRAWTATEYGCVAVATDADGAIGVLMDGGAGVQMSKIGTTSA